MIAVTGASQAVDAADILSDVPTIPERLTHVEDRVAQMWEWINGGPSTKYEDSARGRLHRMGSTAEAADKLAEALREARNDKGRRWAGWEKLGLLAFSALTAAAAWYAALGH